MKRKFFKAIVLCSLALLIGNMAGAQKVITFESHDSKTGHKKSGTAGEGKNSVTVGLLSWFSGYTPVYYERSVLSMLSLQVGAGVTTRSFGADLGYGIYSEGETSDIFTSQNSRNDVKDDYAHYKFRKSLPGLFVSFAPKLYYHDEGMDGAYVSPTISYKVFRFAAQMADETADPTQYGTGDDRLIPHIKQEQSESVRCIDFAVNFGGHYQSRKHVVIGWNTGIGIRNSSAERLDIGVVNDAQNVARYKNAVAEYSKTKLLLTLNFVIGGWF